MEHGRNAEELEGVSLLGNQNTKYDYDYNPDVLETFVNKHPDNDYLVTFDGYEFTSLCPKTGQPDFARIYISYIPNERLVESKSLKLYLFSFRNHGDFHEDCINIIMKDLIKLMDPKYIEVYGIFTPRGGISIYPFSNYCRVDSGYENFARDRKLAHLTNIQNIVANTRRI
ncbi:MAG TPA: preQ(1) synthase [Fervidobacterium sp.]|nr:preQ(1) synthase [Fervidobacterium sp.]